MSGEQLKWTAFRCYFQQLKHELVSTHTPLDLHQGQGNKEYKSYSTLTLTLSSSGPVPSPKDQIDEERAIRNKK